MIQFLQSPSFIAAIGWLLAIGTPLAAILTLRINLKQRTQIKNHRLFWALAASGPTIFLLWFIFNAIENALGLDSILAMLLNLLLFCTIGCLVGAWIRFGIPSRKSSPANEESNPPASDQQS